MKTISLLSLLGLWLGIQLAGAQNTAFTYQGHLSDPTAPAGGTVPYNMVFRIFNVLSGGASLAPAVTANNVPVINGEFSVTLDFGSTPYTGQSLWLQIAVARADLSPPVPPAILAPRQELTPLPYAIFAGTAHALGANGVLLGTPTFDNSSGAPFTVNSTAKVNNLNADLLDGLDSSAFWRTTGNAGTTAGVNFVGTTDNQALELRVNRQRALRLEPTTNSPNLVGGFEGNLADANVVGATIGGGGTVNAMNRILGVPLLSDPTRPRPAQFATISGGAGNSIRGNYYASIGGGANNKIDDSWGLGVDFQTISGGGSNKMDMSPGSTIAGGVDNRIVGDNGDFVVESTIGGGRGNSIETLTDRIHQATVSGGRSNSVYKASHATVGGGRQNFIGAYADQATVAGGAENIINPLSVSATISGGARNAIGSSSTGVTISGGVSNVVASGSGGATIAGGLLNTNAALFGSIVGGMRNWLDGSSDGGAIAGGRSNYLRGFESSIGGGWNNSIVSASRSVIGGGRSNQIGGGTSHATIAGGFNNQLLGLNSESAIGGGSLNTITLDVPYATISGGRSNFISGESRSGVIGGGEGNGIGARSQGGTVGGGLRNSTGAFAEATTIGGGSDNRTGLYCHGATIGGGRNNAINGTAIEGSANATISGGTANQIDSRASSSAIGGGSGNQVAINSPNATIGGGENNRASASYATVPGGSLNAAAGQYSFAAGRRAQALHNGAFVWADSQDADFASTAPNQFLIRAASGVGIGRTPTANALELAGNASKTVAGTWLANSDSRIKTEVHSVTNALSKLAEVRLVGFHYTEDYRAKHPEIGPREYLNVVAQEFQKVFPEHVQSSGERLPNGEEILQVDTHPLTIYSAAAIQELHKLVNKKDAKISVLEEKNSALERRLAEVEKLIHRLAASQDND